MVRRFRAEPVPDAVLDRVLDVGRRGPSAGYSQGIEFVVLHGPDETARYWDVALPVERRGSFGFDGLLAADVLILPCAHAQTYVDRYAEPDKAAAGLGVDASVWPVPFWIVDTSFAAMLMLLAAVDEGLGALFFGLFDEEAAVRAVLGIPEDRTPIGVIAMGWPAEDDVPTGSPTTRARRPADDVIHRGGW
jgi:nitroreductase